MASSNSRGLKSLPSVLDDQSTTALDEFENDQKTGALDKLNQTVLIHQGTTHEDGLEPEVLPLWSTLLADADRRIQNLEAQHQSLNNLRTRFEDIRSQTTDTNLPTEDLTKLVEQSAEELDQRTIDKMSFAMAKLPGLAAAFQQQGLLADLVTRDAIKAAHEQIQGCQDTMSALKNSVNAALTEVSTVQADVDDQVQEVTRLKTAATTAHNQQTTLAHKLQTAGEQEKQLRDNRNTLEHTRHQLSNARLDKTELSQQVEKLKSQAESNRRTNLQQAQTIRDRNSVLTDKDHTIRDLQSDIIRLQDDLQSKDLIIATKNKAIDESQDTLSQLQNEIQARNATIAGKNAAIQSYRRNVSQLQSEMLMKSSVIIQQERSIQAHITTISELYDEMRSKDSIIADLRRELEAEGDAISRLWDGISSKDSTIAQHKSDLQQEASKISEKDQELQSKVNQLMDREIQIRSLNDLIAANRASFEHTLQQQNTVAENLRGELSLSQTTLKEVIETQNGHLSKVMADAILIATNMESRYTIAIESISSIEQRNQTLSAELQSIQKRIEPLQLGVSQRKTNAEVLSQQLKARDSQIVQLFDQFNEAKSMLKANKKQIQKHEETIPKIQSTIDELKTRTVAAASFAETLENNLANRFAKAESLGDDLEHLSGLLNTANQNQTTLQNQMGWAQSLNKKLQLFNSQIKTELGETQANVQNMIEKLSIKSSDVEKLTHENTMLETRLQKSELNCNNLQTEGNRLESEIKTVRDNLAEIKASYIELQAKLGSKETKLREKSIEACDLVTQMAELKPKAETLTVYQNFLEMLSFTPEAINPTLEASLKVAYDFSRNLQGVDPERRLAPIQLACSSTSALSGFEFSLKIMTRATSACSISLADIQSLGVALTNVDENTLRRCLPLIFATVLSLSKQSLNVNGSLFVLRCFDILFQGTCQVTTDLFALMRADLVKSSWLCSTYVDWLTQPVSVNIADAFLTTVGQYTHLFPLQDDYLVVDDRKIFLASRNHGIAVLGPDHIQARISFFDGVTITLHNAPIVGNYSSPATDKYLSQAMSILKPALAQLQQTTASDIDAVLL